MSSAVNFDLQPRVTSLYQALRVVELVRVHLCKRVKPETVKDSGGLRRPKLSIDRESEPTGQTVARADLGAALDQLRVGGARLRKEPAVKLSPIETWKRSPFQDLSEIRYRLHQCRFLRLKQHCSKYFQLYMILVKCRRIVTIFASGVCKT